MAASAFPRDARGRLHHHRCGHDSFIENKSSGPGTTDSPGLVFAGHKGKKRGPAASLLSVMLGKSERRNIKSFLRLQEFGFAKLPRICE
jgi:hypothetical protein